MCRIGLALILWLGTSYSIAATPSIALYYGADPPWNELQAFDVVVVEPGHRFDPRAHSTPRSELFAYVSVGEVHPDKPVAKEIPSDWKVGSNTAWGSIVIDQAQPEWPRFFAERVVAPLWQAGYRGFFLDTLDSFQLVSKTDPERVRQQAGLIALVRELRRQFPQVRLIFNRGFEILPQVHQEVFAVAAESVYRGWDAGSREYREVPAADREWLTGQLKRVSTEYGLPVLAIDYVAPGERELARETARRIAGLGFIPWVSNPELDQLGVGSVEVMPRRVLMLYEGDGNDINLTYDRILRLATMPLNYLGYVAEYVDVSRPLPALTLAGRYAGIVTWFISDQPANAVALREWLARARQQGIKLAVFGNFAFPLTGPVARSFGLHSAPVRLMPQTLSITARDDLMGFEAAVTPDRRNFVPLRADQATPLLQLRSEVGETMDAAALTAWGGYVLSPYDILTLPGDDTQRWVVQPIEFLRRALALPVMPVPDVTTENGRRLMLAHMDGDGLASRAEAPGSPFTGQVLLREILEKYHAPITVSVIQGEIAPDGLYPKLSPELERNAREIFALPHVEIASHTFSHPFRWSTAADKADPNQYHLDIPGYVFNFQAEIAGSLNYINTRLAPPGKIARMILWSGDCNPGSEPLDLAYQAGVANMNGGETIITRRDKSLTMVGPLGITKGGNFQVYAPNQNENVYTGNWTGPFYGYERVIETFELTDRPYRLKPINIYFHAYSLSKRASLQSLHKVYQWAMAQPVMGIHTSEYFAKVLDFNRMVVARSAEGWLIRGAGDLREVRMPAAAGVPDLRESRAVAGFSEHQGERYVHLADGNALLKILPQQTSRSPYVADANGRIERWQQGEGRVQFGLRGHTPLRFTLANAADCSVEGDGKAIAGTKQGIMTRYELRQNAIERIAINCQR